VTELLGLAGMFAGLMLAFRAGIMALDDRRSLMLRPIPIAERND
jgi:hypothetical protein